MIDSASPRLIDPEREAERLAALRRYDILDTPPDGAFERLTALAARLFDVPIAIVSLVDHDRIWFKSHHGLEVDEVDRDPGLCASAILQDNLWVVEDARSDPRALANPLVVGELGLQFYAGAPIRTNDGHNLGTLCVIDREPRTITPEEEATLVDLAQIAIDEIELRLAARSQQERLDDVRSDFVATVSHEIRTPLAAIYGAAVTLRRPALDEQMREQLLGVVIDQSDRLAALVAEILTASQIQAGRMQFQLEPVDAGAAVQEVIDAARPRLPEGLELVCGVFAHVPSVVADPGKLRLVLENLVDNAIKYSPEGGSIEIGATAAAGTVRFEIRDSGLGIPPAEHERIFEKFYRLDPNLVRGVAGTGLGLFICRELVRGMGGTIGVDSAAGDGSVFSFALPAA